MKLVKRLVRSLSWLALFNEAEIGFDAETGELGVVVPGQLKENGKPNTKGNVIVAIQPNQVDDLLLELRLLSTVGRVATPAEVVRRTYTVSEGIASFKVSDASGARTVKVKVGEVPAFLNALEDKLIDAGELQATAAALQTEEDAVNAPEATVTTDDLTLGG